MDLNLLVLNPGASVYETPEKYGIKRLDTTGRFQTPFSTETMSWGDIINAYEELAGSLMALSLVRRRPKHIFYRNLK